MKRPEKVFCIGWAKTGTTSLGQALAMLGYAHASSRLDLFEHLETGDMAPIFECSDRFDSFDDWPWILLFKEMTHRYPEAKFILTLRDETELAESYRKMLAQELRRHERIRGIRRFIYGFDTEFGSDRQFVDRVRSHNDEVRGFFANRPDQLLEMRLSDGDGWEKLCGFLSQPVPDEPFPHANAAKDRSRSKTAIRRPMVALRKGFYRLTHPDLWRNS